MPYQNISATLSAADIQAVKDAISAIEAKLPFRVTLTNDERKSLFKTGSSRLSLVADAAAIAQNHPNIFPAAFDTAEFLRDFTLFQQLTELKLAVDSLASQVDDTCLALGSEAAKAALQVKDYAEAAEDTVPGLKPLVEKLAQHFERSGKTAPATPPTT
jgi:hypothetical protein